MPDLLFGPVPHDDAIDFLKSKAPVSRAVFDGLLPELRARAFCVSGIEDVNVLQRVRDKIAELPAGARWDDVKKDIVGDISPFLVDPDADDEERDRQITSANRRAELLLRTHGFQAYQSAAHDVAQRNQDTHPYLQYMTMEDDSVRPSHAALDGLILPLDSPFWKDHTPPWDWGCRCQAVPISKDDYHDAQTVDAKLPHDDRMILDDSRQRELETTGRLVRGPNRITNCASPVAMGKPGAFRWHPGDLRLPLDQLQARYAPDIWHTFQTWAQAQGLDHGVTVWEWLNGQSLSEPPGRADDERRRLSPEVIGRQVALEGMNRTARRRVAEAEATVAGLPIEKSYGFDRNGRVIMDKVGDQSSVSFTDDELRRVRGAVLTHNHPNGSSFSEADVRLAFTRQLRELRVVAGGQVFSLTPGQGEQFDPRGYANVKRAWDRLSPSLRTAPDKAGRLHQIWKTIAAETGFNYSVQDRENAD